MKKGAWLVLSEDVVFQRKVELICERLGLVARTDGRTEGDVPLIGCIRDLDTASSHPIPDAIARVLPFSRREEEHAYPIPTPIALLEQLLTAHEIGLTLDSRERTATLGARKILLTEMEFALLARLVEAEGEALTQQELLRDVWHGEASAGTVNVYVHYLRQKLESGGERILRQKRGHGYYVDAKYAKGAIVC